MAENENYNNSLRNNHLCVAGLTERMTFESLQLLRCENDDESISLSKQQLPQPGCSANMDSS